MNENEKPLVCPRCGEEFPADATVWLYAGRYYCSQRCARITWGSR